MTRRSVFCIYDINWPRMALLFSLRESGLVETWTGRVDPQVDVFWETLDVIGEALVEELIG